MSGPDLFGDKPKFDRFPPPRYGQGPAHEALRDGARAGNKRQLLMAPTGAGKTYLALRAIVEALMKARRAMFICDRITLIEQTSKTADAYGVPHGVYQADHWRTDVEQDFQIASTQTIDARGAPPGKFDLVVVDECHSRHKGWLNYLENYDGYVIGLSATPFTRGLGKIFTNLVNAATMAELVEHGVLVPLRVLSLTKPNMRGAKKADGEYTAESAGERGIKIIGMVVPEYIKHGEGRKGIYFGATIAHCEQLCRQFNEAGIMAAVFCADTTPSEREQILTEFRKPDSAIRVVISVSALAKGFDVPDIRLVGDCRPLRKGLSDFMQMVGRGLRSDPAPDTIKTDCLLLDHSGNIVRFAQDFEAIYWNGLKELNEGELLDATARQDIKDKDVRGCPKCGHSPFMGRCISCGHKQQRAQTINHEEATGVREIIIGKRKLADDREHLYRQFVSHALQRKPETAEGFAANLYREAMGSWPPEYFSFHAAVRAKVPVTKAVADRVRARLIAYRKGLESRA